MREYWGLLAVCLPLTDWDAPHKKWSKQIEGHNSGVTTSSRICLSCRLVAPKNNIKTWPVLDTPMVLAATYTSTFAAQGSPTQKTHTEYIASYLSE